MKSIFISMSSLWIGKLYGKIKFFSTFSKFIETIRRMASKIETLRLMSAYGLNITPAYSAWLHVTFSIFFIYKGMSCIMVFLLFIFFNIFLTLEISNKLNKIFRTHLLSKCPTIRNIWYGDNHIGDTIDISQSQNWVCFYWLYILRTTRLRSSTLTFEAGYKFLLHQCFKCFWKKNVNVAKCGVIKPCPPSFWFIRRLFLPGKLLVWNISRYYWP
jgi:hypothetical protein